MCDKVQKLLSKLEVSFGLLSKICETRNFQHTKSELNKPNCNLGKYIESFIEHYGATLNARISTGICTSRVVCNICCT